MSLVDTWYDVYARALLGRSIRAALVYDLLYKLLAAALFAPLGAFALNELIRTSGGVSITNEAIAAFLLSPFGWAFLLLALAFALASFHSEQSGLVHIAAGASRGKPAGWAEALATTAGALPRLLELALWQAAILLLWLLPVAALAGLTYGLLLGQHDINWYLANRPPAFTAALALGAVLAAVTAGVLLRFLVDWALSIPVCLYEGLRGRAALRRSRDLVRGQRLRALWLLALNLGLGLGLSALALALTHWLVGLALGALDSIGALIAATALALVLFVAVGALASFLLLALYAVVVMHLYLEILGVDGLPTQRWERADRAPRIPHWAVAAVLLALLGAAVAVTQARLDDLRLGRETAVTAHRGSSKLAPENTLAAIYQSLTDGADYVEIDVQETADGVLVLLHDKDLMRVAGLPTKIWEARYEDLKRVDVGRWFSDAFAGEQIPTLEEALVVAGDRLGLNIELKYNGHDQRLAERVVETLRAQGCPAGCIITSLSRDGLTQVRKLAPELTIGQIVTVAIGNPAGLDVDLLSMSQDKVTPGRVRANRAAGLATHVWTVDDPDDMARMLDYGVDNIITNEPARLRALIDERAELSDPQLLLLALGRSLREQ